MRPSLRVRTAWKGKGFLTKDGEYLSEPVHCYVFLCKDISLELNLLAKLKITRQTSDFGEVIMIGFPVLMA